MNVLVSKIGKLNTLLCCGVLIIAIGSAGIFGYIKNGGHFTLGPISMDGSMAHVSESHAEFEQECTHCHGPIHCVDSDGCQECHLEVAQQRLDNTGLHGILPGTARCQTCHIEHRGRDAVISEVAFNNINHQELSGFSLAKHATDGNDETITCDDCHVTRQFAADHVDCHTCHLQEDSAWLADHTAAHGPSCLSCHDGQDRMAAFSHISFVLDGAHLDLTCISCHENQQFTNTAQACAACHREPTVHAGLFGEDCARCHTAVAWAPAHLQHHTFLINHGSEDEEPDCITCHVSSYAEVTCAACHESGELQTLHLEADADFDSECACCHPTGQPGEATNPLAVNRVD